MGSMAGTRGEKWFLGDGYKKRSGGNELGVA